jgi:hypothetical protein
MTMGEDKIVTWTFNAVMLPVMRKAMQVAVASAQFSADDTSWLQDWADDAQLGRHDG